MGLGEKIAIGISFLSIIISLITIFFNHFNNNW